MADIIQKWNRELNYAWIGSLLGVRGVASEDCELKPQVICTLCSAFSTFRIPKDMFDYLNINFESRWNVLIVSVNLC